MNSIRRLERKFQKKYNNSIRCSAVRDSIRVEGQVMTWDEVVAIGHAAAKTSFKQVVNDVTLLSGQHVKLAQGDKQDTKTDHDENHPEINCDVLIIGAGIIGTSIARELSKYNLSIIVVDKEYDVAVHTSSRNDGMIHPGIASPTFSLKTKMNVRGNFLYDQVSEELGVPIRRCGSSILFRSQFSKVLIPYFFIKAMCIGMPGLSILNKKKVYEKEPHLTDGIVWGIFCASAAVTTPYKMTVAYAENAIMNGVKLMLNTEVSKMTMKGETAKNLDKIEGVHTNRGCIKAQLVINAAGVYSDIIAEMAHDRYYSIHPRKGEIILLDKKKAHLVRGILGFVGDRSSKNTKGGGVIRTYEDNILIGPNAFEVMEREDYSTDGESVMQLLKTKLPQIKGLVKEDTITYFTGIRAATYKEDFIIEASDRVDNLIHVAGIQSPGFASAPAIAERVEALVSQHFRDQSTHLGPLEKRIDWNPIRPSIPDLSHMTYKERKLFISQRPDYGEIICRCEEISKGEILDALKSPIEVNSIDAVKRRVRAGMGRCQGGFCLPLVMEIIHQEKGIAMDRITKKGGNSTIAVHMTKEA